MMNRNTYHPPIIVTMDLEIAYDHVMDQQVSILDQLIEDTDIHGIPMTVFTTSESTKLFSTKVKLLHSHGHEIGCHGKTHASVENFETMDYSTSKSIITESTNVLEAITGVRPRSFRGPRMETSVATQRALIDCGYQSDYSVSSRRLYLPPKMDLFFAPQTPYFSHENSHLKAGTLPLLNVPLTSVGVPFLSGMLYILGLPAMKALFQFYYRLCQLQRRPLIYLFHSYEGTKNLSPAEIIHSKSVNPYFSDKPSRQKMYRFSAEKKYQLNIQLLRYMCNYKGVRPMTAATFFNEYSTQHHSQFVMN